MEMIKSDAQIDLVHVPYKATPSGVRDVMAGEVQLMFVTIGTVRNQVKAGLLKPLAVTSLKRSGVMPQVPTVAESGLPHYESVVWYSVLAPAGTPSAIVSKLNQEINKVLKSQDYQQRLAQEAVEVSGSSPEQLQTFMKSEMIKWAKVVKESGAKVD
jgi:tripartite-type tricarboxylate transporter receptor subunit TctC